jgi:hypothetical protein
MTSRMPGRVMARRTPLIFEPGVEEFFDSLARMAAHPLHGERVERVVRKVRAEEKAKTVRRSDGAVEPKAASDMRMRNAEIAFQVRLYTSAVIVPADGRVLEERHLGSTTLEVWRLLGRSKPFTLQRAYEMTAARYGVSVPTVKNIWLKSRKSDTASG